ncbi:MAG TPA: response regulator [Polyangia bacterium]|nr:response regulator [Polyangia bacterium]
MAPTSLNPLIDGPPRRVLLVVDDPTLAELLVEALEDAGHAPVVTDGLTTARAAFDRQPFDAAIVDLDTRARNGAEVVSFIREHSPATTVIALLPCGGMPGATRAIAYHMATEKPARLEALLSAIRVSHDVETP